MVILMINLRCTERLVWWRCWCLNVGHGGSFLLVCPPLQLCAEITLMIRKFHSQFTVSKKPHTANQVSKFLTRPKIATLFAATKYQKGKLVDPIPMQKQAVAAIMFPLEQNRACFVLVRFLSVGRGVPCRHSYLVSYQVVGLFEYKFASNTSDDLAFPTTCTGR